MPPRQDGFGNPQSVHSPHPPGLFQQVGSHLGVVPCQPASHLKPISGIERQVGEADLLHPFGKTPSPLVTAHQTCSAVPLARDRSPIDACQRIEMHVIGRAEPVGHLVRTLDSQQRFAPVVSPPHLLLGLERFQRDRQRRLKFPAGGRQRVAIGCDRGGDHEVVPRRPLFWQNHRGLFARGAAALWPDLPRSQHDRRTTPFQRVAVSIEVIFHPRVGQVRPRRPSVNLGRVDRRV